MESVIASQRIETMKAVVQDGYGSADVLHFREIDRPTITEDRVLVRVRAASVNALDWHTVHGGKFMRAAAFVMRQPTLGVRGADMAGEVEAVGANVTRLRPGDQVFGMGRGTFAEFTTAREDFVVPMPRGLSFEQAATLGVAAFTALQGLRDVGQVKPGQRVLIYGAGGGVGTFAVQIAKALGAHVTAATSTRNLELVRSLEPDELFDYTQEDFTRRGRTYDVFFDVGGNRSLADCRRVLTPTGTLVLAGAGKGSAVAPLTRLAAGLLRSKVFGQRVVPFLAKNSYEDLVVLKELVEAGKLRPAIDRTYPLDEVPDAVRYVGSGQARAKVVITVS